MSKNFEKVKKYYDNYLTGKYPQWDKTKVYNAVGKWITKTEYKTITGETYE